MPDERHEVFLIKNNMYIKIKKAELVPNKFGSDIVITMVGLYDDSGKWIKWIKLNDVSLQVFIDAKINLI